MVYMDLIRLFTSLLILVLARSFHIPTFQQNQDQHSMQRLMHATTAIARSFDLSRNGATKLINEETIAFSSMTSEPISIHTSRPLPLSSLKENDCLTFTVKLPVKMKRTAIGFAFNQPERRYLTPDYIPEHGNYISMGGAGYVYPMKKKCRKGYGEGDSITCTIYPQLRRVTFGVNNDIVFDGILPTGLEIDQVYPTVSSEGGAVEAQVYLDAITN